MKLTNRLSNISSDTVVDESNVFLELRDEVQPFNPEVSQFNPEVSQFNPEVSQFNPKL